MRYTRQATRRRQRTIGRCVLLGVLAALSLAASAAPAGAVTLPPGFTEAVVMSDLKTPTAVRFGADGKVYVAEKAGIVKEFDGLADTTPRIVVDLRTKVMDYFDRGLLGLALPPDMTADPSVYVAYSLDAPIGGTPPVFNDVCPAANLANCVTGARVSRIAVATGAEQKLLEDWCMQYNSHTIGSLAFAPDGALYVSGGEGADYNRPDWGQNGVPPNPCGDPPAPAGTALATPTAEGGALRSQDVRTPADPTGLDGTILRIDPLTGAGKAGNPFASSGDANARRMTAYGLRNPFRLTLRPGTGELWFGDVGWGTIEEINRVVSPADATAENFGWPCFEGDWRQPFYTGLTLCDSLLASQTTSPRFTYHHDQPIVAGENCPNGGASVSAIAFAPPGGAYPSEYDGALFFGDYSRSCIWVLPKGADGLPNPAAVKVFETGASSPVDLQAGPGGVLYYADLLGGTIRRLGYSASKPVAQFSASPSAGAVPLTVAFDASGSSDPGGLAISYAWDFDGDGVFEGSGRQATHTYTTAGRFLPALKVTNSAGASSTATQPVSVGVPVATIGTPGASTMWAANQSLSFSGSAVDSAGAPIPAQDLQWTVVLEHGACPACHEHPMLTMTGSSGTVTAPDHEYPSSILLRLTATDGELVGTATRRLQPRTVGLTFASSPAGLSLSLDGAAATAPFTRTAIVASAHAVEAPAIQSGLTFSAWSDGGARTHALTTPATPATYTATYVNRPPMAAFTVSTATPNRKQAVTFDASASSDPEGTALTYAWDLDGDGQYDDATGRTTSRSYARAGTVTVRLRVTDARSGTATAQRTITVANRG